MKTNFVGHNGETTNACAGKRDQKKNNKKQLLPARHMESAPSDGVKNLAVLESTQIAVSGLFNSFVTASEKSSGENFM